MNEKVVVLSVEDLSILLQGLQLMINHIAITDTDTYMRDFKARIEAVINKIIL